MRFIFVFFLLSISFFLNSQQLIISDENKSYNLNTLIQFYTDSSKLLSEKQVLIEIENEKQESSFSTGRIVFDSNKSRYWGKFTLKNKLDKALFYIFKLENVHLDYANLYLVEDGIPKLIGKTGDQLKLHKKTIQHRLNIFELSLAPASETTFLFYFERNKKNVLDFTLKPVRRFIDEESNYNAVVGFYIGFLFLMAFLAFFTYFFVKKKVYLFYTGFIVFGCLSTIYTSGYIYRYFIFNFPQLNSLVFGLIVNLYLFFFLLFSRDFILVKTLSDRVQSIVKWFISVYAILIVLGNISYYFYNNNWFNFLQYGFILLVYSFMLIVAFLSYRKGNKIVIFFIISFLPFVLGFSAFILMRVGLIHTDFLYKYLLYVVSFFQSFMLSIGVIVLIKNQLLENKNLALKIVQQELEYNQKVHNAIENNHKEIANHLHDNFGFKLKQIQSLISKNENLKAKKALVSFSEELRNISHSMSPTLLDHLTLSESIYDLAQTFSKGDLKVLFYSSVESDHLAKINKIKVYNIVHELLNNIYKHANAKLVMIQISDEDNFITISIEDDGIGFELNREITLGFGLNTIYKRMHTIDGEFILESSPGKGTLAILKLKNAAPNGTAF